MQHLNVYRAMFNSVQICIFRKEGQWQCGLVSKKYLEPTCDTDTSMYEGAFDPFQIVPDAELIVSSSSPGCTCNQCNLENVMKQLTDDFEFDDTKQELKEYDVAASASGTVSDYRF